jgi:CheY-like chemotaxis protein
MALLDGLSILYVEDEPDTREVIAMGLERHGACVHATDSAPAALLMFQAQRSDVVIADLELPDVDGWTFMRALRTLPTEREKRTLAIALTAHNTRADKLKSLEHGFTLHMAKPLTPDQLAQRIALVLGTAIPKDRD